MNRNPSFAHAVLTHSLTTYLHEDPLLLILIGVVAFTTKSRHLPSSYS